MSMTSASAPLRALWQTALDAAAAPLIFPDLGTDLATYQRWVEERLAPWLDARAEQVHTMMGAYRYLRGGAADERTIGAALFAHVCEDTAAQVLAAPLPRAADDPAVAAQLRQTLETRVEPLRERARVYYDTCMTAGVGAGPHVDVWIRFCAERRRESAPIPYEGL